MARFGINALLGQDRQFQSVEEAVRTLGKQGSASDK
jgi:hypothetical protein